MAKMTSGNGWAFVSEKDSLRPASADSCAPKLKILVEKRSGRKVTVISGIHTYGEPRLQEIARALKALCGAGGTVKNGTIEIQGDKAVQVQAWFKKQEHEPR